MSDAVQDANGKTGLTVVWRPSKKALSLARFPDGIDPHVAYNMQWDLIPEQTKVTGFERFLAHRFNNEASSALQNARESAEDNNESFDPVQWLHEYRLKAIQEIYEGRLGVRRVSTAAEPVLSELDREIQDRAFETVRDYINRKGGACNYQKRDARSLAWKNADGETMQQLIDKLLTVKRGKAIVEKAKQVVAEREAARAAAAAEDEDIFEEDEAAE